MFSNSFVTQLTLFASVTGALAFLFLLIGRGESRIRTRLHELMHPDDSIRQLRRETKRSFREALKNALQSLGARLLPNSEARRMAMQLRLVHAGVYASSGLSILAATKLILVLPPLLIGVLLAHLEIIPQHQRGQFIGCSACMGAGIGLLLPSLWLDWKKHGRQTKLRRSLPDFLDLMVVCLDSGMSLESALQRVTDEIHEAHPMLGDELVIVQREISLGRTPETALHNLAERTALDVLKLLVTYVRQSRKVGTSMSDTLRTHADMLRTKREMRAEELAQKAAVMVLFPTLLFIFPAVFVVLVGPAALEIYDKFATTPDVAVHEKATS